MKAEIGTDHQHGRYVRVTIGDGIGFVRSTTVYADDPCHKAREDKIARLEDQLERTQGYEARMADRLAAIERQVIYRTEDMPAWARWWHKGYGWNGNCEFLDEFKETVRTGAPDFRPDEHGPLFMPIIDAPDAGGEDT